jgi:hypothetical protein
MVEGSGARADLVTSRWLRVPAEAEGDDGSRWDSIHRIHLVLHLEGDVGQQGRHLQADLPPAGARLSRREDGR